MKRRRWYHFLMFGMVVIFLMASVSVQSQEKKRIRISNANFSFTALPLIAARDWKFFSEQGLEVKIILMRSAAAAAALASGDLERSKIELSINSLYSHAGN